MRTSVITQSTYDSVSLNEIKSHLRINYGVTREDDFFIANRSVAINYVENYLNRKLTKQTVKYYLDDFPDRDYVELPYPPVIKIPSSGLRYTNSTGQIKTFSSTKWTQDVISEPGRLVLNYGEDWPNDTLANNSPISIEYRCGYGSSNLGSFGSSNVRLPAALRHAILMSIGAWYESREEYAQTTYEFKKMPIGAANLMYSYRIKTF